MEIASILFAAGRGRRLQPLTNTIPKPALPLLDLPLGAFGLHALSHAAPPVAVNVGRLGELVVQALSPFGAFETIWEQPEPFGTAGTVSALIDRVAATVVTLNSDVLTDLDPASVLQAHELSGSPATIAVRRVTERADIAVEDGLVTAFFDRRLESNPGHQFLGMGVFDRTVLSGLPLRIPGGLGEQVLAPLASVGLLRVFEYEGYFIDVGTFERFLRASLDLLHGHGPTPPAPWPGRIVDRAGSPAYVGPDATVSEDSLGPGAIVLAGARVDPAAHLTRTVVSPGDRVPRVHLSDAVWYSGRTM